MSTPEKVDVKAFLEMAQEAGVKSELDEFVKLSGFKPAKRTVRPFLGVQYLYLFRNGMVASVIDLTIQEGFEVMSGDRSSDLWGEPLRVGTGDEIEDELERVAGGSSFPVVVRRWWRRRKARA